MDLLLGKLLKELEGVIPVASEHGIATCKNSRCPAKIHYDAIEYEGDDGVMFLIGNLLHWVSAKDLSFDRDEQTFDMCLGEAIVKEWV